MPYVQRDKAGAITGRFANAQPGYAEEFLAEDHPEIAALEKASEDAESNRAILSQLQANDLKAVRALVEGDTERINAHKAEQAALRSELRSADQAR